MRRTFLLFLAAFAGLLLLASVALWIRSFFIRDVFPQALRQPGVSLQVQSCRGRLVFCVVRETGSSPRPVRLTMNVVGTSLPNRSFAGPGTRVMFSLSRATPFNLYGFSTASGRVTTTQAVLISGKRGNVPISDAVIHLYCVPDWILCLLLGGLMFPGLLIWRRRRRAGQFGLCLRCGYDLRASQDRCPECGSPIRYNAASSSQPYPEAS